MNRLVWLDAHDLAFPNIAGALNEPNGLLAAGGDLSINRLLQAYRHGIFPWYDDDQPILWWSPDPRCVIAPQSFVPSKSLAKRLKRQDYVIRVDQNFRAVIEHCKTRGPEEGTWITEAMKSAYIQLHEAGQAHSVECYIEGELVGGLYGISLGKLFFGESMFHRVTDASKIAFASLMQMMSDHGCPLVDCQIANPHLFSLGAYEISRSEFKSALDTYVGAEALPWQQIRDSMNLPNPGVVG